MAAGTGVVLLAVEEPRYDDTVSRLPSVRALLAERFIFNFRMPPESMRQFLPVEWLSPATVGGHAIASFCLLDLRNITVAPLPMLAGLSSLSCAPRYAVIDESVDPPRPAVYVTERYTNSSFGAWFTSLGFSAPHPYVEASIQKTEATTHLSVTDRGTVLFEATVRETPEAATTSVFTPGTFARFIAEGVSSYGLSVYAGRLTKVDLHKADAAYEPLETIRYGGPAVEAWLQAGAALDSAYRTAQGRYEWTYHGLTS